MDEQLGAAATGSAGFAPADEAAPDAPHTGSEGSTSHADSGPSGAAREAAPPPDLGGALAGLLRRGMPHGDEFPGQLRLNPVLRDLRASDRGLQLTALTELSEQLSFSSEESLQSFPIDACIPALIGLLENPGGGDEISAQVMLLSCRCIFSIIDIIPSTARSIVAAGGLPVLCANLLNVEYIDVAERAIAIIELVSEDQPLQVLKAGGLQAILTFLDFFQISTQRQAANAAAQMLLPLPPPELLDQHVQPALPTLAQLLQHPDPQVLLSICECWRRLLDNAVAARRAQAGGSHGGGAGDGSSAGVSAALEEACPSNALSNMLALLGSASLTSPPLHGPAVVPEVLYILAVLTNYSESFAEEVLKQGACAMLQRMATTERQGPSSPVQAACLLRALAVVASMLPMVRLTPGSPPAACCEERRLAFFRKNPDHLEAIAEAFLPLLPGLYEAPSADPSAQSLCVMLLLALLLTCRGRPELVRKLMSPARMAAFLANLLTAGASGSVTLACVLMAGELLDADPEPYRLLLERHGVAQAVRKLASAAADEAPRGSTSPAQMAEQAAQSVFAAHFDPSHGCKEAAVMPSLRAVAEQLRRAPGAEGPGPREALDRLRDLLLDGEGVTAFELSSSGVARALNDFLHPPDGDGEAPAPAVERSAEALRLFIDSLARPPGGALESLVRLSVSSLRHLEHMPVGRALTPAAGAAATLPPHLRGRAASGAGARAHGAAGAALERPPVARPGRGGGPSRPQDPASASATLSALRLLAKPVRVKLSPASATESGGSGAQAPGAAAAASSSASAARAPAGRARPGSGEGASSSSEPPCCAAAAAAAATPALRLRDYIASKVGSRKRGAPSPPGDAGALEAAAAAAARAAKAASAHADRREPPAEAPEVVLLVEPFAPVSTLEDWVKEKYGPRAPRGVGGSEGRHPAPPPPDGPAPAASAASGAAPPPAGRLGSARQRLRGKQAPPQASPPSGAAAPSAAGAGPGASGSSRSPRAPRAAAPAAAAGAGRAAEGRRVRISLDGALLPSKTSVVQSLVSYAPPAPAQPPEGRAPAPAEEQAAGAGGHEQPARCAERFLACVEDAGGPAGAGEDPLGAGRLGGGGAAPSQRSFQLAVWGQVHAMTYEFVSAEEYGDAASAPTAATASSAKATQFVPTRFDCLVHRHAQAAQAIAALETPAAPGRRGPGGAEDSGGPSRDSEAELTTMLQLTSALRGIWEHLHEAEGALNMERPDDGLFHCNALTSLVMRQLSDPLAVCTGSVPAWCRQLVAACRFLFPRDVRRSLHQSCSLGVGRAAHHLQQRVLAQHAHSQEALRRLEGEVAVANVPRQKVRISRQHILESAIKVMDLYAAGSTILEVEYSGEVGTGLGPTLEFYAQVVEMLRSSEPRLFRQTAPLGLLFPEPRPPEPSPGGDSQALAMFRLLGQLVAKCVLDGRLVDLRLHPLFWRMVLGGEPVSQCALRDVDPELFARVDGLRALGAEAIESLALDFTLPGHPDIELRPGGADVRLSAENVDEYVALVSQVSLVTACAPQATAFREAFARVLPLEACRVWSEEELSTIVAGASASDGAFWTVEHMEAHVLAQHGYSASSRCYRDLLATLADFDVDDRRRFLTFVTGAPTLPVGGFAGLKPPLTVVKKEAPPSPMTPDQFMPSVMTCANYLKLPEYSSAEALRRQLGLAIREGQAAFHLS